MTLQFCADLPPHTAGATREGEERRSWQESRSSDGDGHTLKIIGEHGSWRVWGGYRSPPSHHAERRGPPRPRLRPPRSGRPRVGTLRPRPPPRLRPSAGPPSRYRRPHRPVSPPRSATLPRSPAHQCVAAALSVRVFVPHDARRSVMPQEPQPTGSGSLAILWWSQDVQQDLGGHLCRGFVGVELGLPPLQPEQPVPCQLAPAGLPCHPPVTGWHKGDAALNFSPGIRRYALVPAEECAIIAPRSHRAAAIRQDAGRRKAAKAQTRPEASPYFLHCDRLSSHPVDAPGHEGAGGRAPALS